MRKVVDKIYPTNEVLLTNVNTSSLLLFKSNVSGTLYKIHWIKNKVRGTGGRFEAVSFLDSHSIYGGRGDTIHEFLKSLANKGEIYEFSGFNEFSIWMKEGGME